MKNCYKLYQMNDVVRLGCDTAVPLCEIHAAADAKPKQGSGTREETLRDIHKKDYYLMNNPL